MAPQFSKILTRNNVIASAGVAGALLYLTLKKQRQSLKLVNKWVTYFSLNCKSVATVG